MKEESFYRELVDRYKSGKASDDELLVFFQLMKEGRLDHYLDEGFRMKNVDGDGTGEEDSVNGSSTYVRSTSRIVRLRRIIAVAAAVIVVTTLSIIIFLSDRSLSVNGKDPATTVATSSAAEKKGVRLLAGAAAILLDSASNGLLALPEGPAIVKKGDQIIYSKVGPETQGETTHILTTTRGKQYRAILSDGTAIWLNAASSLQFPSGFSANERIVQLNGECYFEVARNTARPFKVQLQNGVIINVTGTHFNIQAYPNETVKATLLEGSIDVKTKLGAATLKPNQEAVVNDGGKLTVNSNADIKKAVAWKDGLFYFDRADISSISKEIERWYDVEVIFEGPVPQKSFVGKVSRESNIEEVLQILELSGIHFRKEGRKIFILP